DGHVTGVQTCALPISAIVWRTHLPVRNGRQPTKKETEGFFEAAPPHTSELLETETHRVIEWLGKRGLALMDRANEGEKGLPGKEIGRASCRERVEIRR